MSASLLHNPLSPSAWDFSASSSYADLSDSDFLAMLEKQVSGGAPTTTTTTNMSPSALNTSSMLGGGGSGFTLTPPLSEEDSSPSPPNTELDHRASSSGTPEDSHANLLGGNPKRKLSIDDDDDDLADEAPLSKSAHRANSGMLSRLRPRGAAQHAEEDQNAHVGHVEDKKGHARRKSIPHQKDENRLMKRKEQNRAAQRAFRERKEKHVHDLEDRVAILEQEKSEQAHENENLKDLLTRLQSENQMLKQGQFTFSMPTANPSTSSLSSSLKRKSTADASPAGSSSSGEQVPVFAQTSPPVVDTSGFNATLFSTPSSSSSDPSTSAAATSDPLTGMFGSFPQTTTWTTLATAPQYTSYRDPIYDRLFGGAGDISPYATRGDDGEDGSGPGLATLEDLFGEEFGDLIPIVGDFSPAAEAVLGGGVDASFTSTEDDEAAAPAAAMAVDDPVVVQHHPTRPEEVEGFTPCPNSKDGVARMVGQPEQTFGPPLATAAVPSPPSGPSSATNLSSAFSSISPSPTAVSVSVNEMEEECPFASGLGSGTPLPKVGMGEGPHVSVGEAWKRVRGNPHFEECDIDDLCAQLKEKARCDSGRPVIEESTVREVIARMDMSGSIMMA